MKSIKKYTEPPFWDNIIDNEPICHSLTQNFKYIQKEVLRLNKLSNILFTNYPVLRLNLKKNEHYFVDSNVGWKISPFFGGRYDVNVKRRSPFFILWQSDILAYIIRLLCPKTTKLLRKAFKEKIILNAYFTKLSPGSTIKPHYHPISNGIHRMNLHLGLLCDPSATITVGEETRTWEEGKLIAFKNSGPYRHSVDHRGTKDRIILIVEIDVKYLEKYGVFKGERIIDEVL